MKAGRLASCGKIAGTVLALVASIRGYPWLPPYFPQRLCPEIVPAIKLQIGTLGLSSIISPLKYPPSQCDMDRSVSFQIITVAVRHAADVSFQIATVTVRRQGLYCETRPQSRQFTASFVSFGSITAGKRTSASTQQFLPHCTCDECQLQRKLTDPLAMRTGRHQRVCWLCGIWIDAQIWHSSII